MKTPAALAALALTALALVPEPAEACSPLPDMLRAVRPADGAADVPTNARLILAFDGFGYADVQATYQVDGATTAVDLGVVSYDAEGVLPATLALPAGAPGETATVTLTPVNGDGGEPMTTTFTYGSAEDATPPPAPAAPDIYLEAHTSDGNTCEPFESGDFLKVSPPASLDPDAVAYAVYVRHPDRVGEEAEPFLAYWRLATDGAADRRLGFYEAAESVCVTARAVDAAGNASAASDEVCIDANTGCESAQGSLPIFAALGLVLGAMALGRRRRA